MRIHVGDVGGAQRAVRERAPHRQRGAGAVLRRLRDVVRVAREAIAAHLHHPGLVSDMRAGPVRVCRRCVCLACARAPSHAATSVISTATGT